MKKIRLYVEQTLHSENLIELNKQQSHYLTKVMRLRVKDELLVFNGEQGEWICEIISTQASIVTLNLKEQSKEQIETSDIWLLFAPIKNTRLPFIIEKGTELGVTKFIPVLTQNAVVRELNIKKLNLTAIEAAEQCERLSVPSIDPVVSLKKLLDNWHEQRRIIFCDESRTAKPLKDLCTNFKQGEKIAILVGPEGGFSLEETKLMYNLPFIFPIHLGPRILRAETAALSAISCVQALLGDWN